jgi:D-3-phosphoglycerate dehydrogenase
LLKEGSSSDVLVMVVAPVTAAVLERLTRCRAIVKAGVGVDTIDLQAAAGLGIPVANVGSYCAEELADHALALILALVRKLKQGDLLSSNLQWDRTLLKPIHRLSSLTIGVVGLGASGATVARRFEALGCRIVYTDVDAARAQEGWRSCSLQELLDQADVVSIHIPLTDETRHLFGSREFSQMKPGAVIVNTSRGEVVDSDALRVALTEGRIGGAGLDVWKPEPPLPDEPLLKFPNVIFSPHLAGYSEESFDELRARVVKQVLQVKEGNAPTWTLNGVRQLRGIQV